MSKTFSIFYLKEKDKFLFCRKPIQAYIYYRDFRINLLTGERENYPIRKFLAELQRMKMNFNPSAPMVVHLFYEFGYVCQGLDELVPAKKMLAITIDYADYQILTDLPFRGEGDISLEAKDYPKFKSYKRKFDKVYSHLIDGDCYQVNLTGQFYFRFNEQIQHQDFISALWRERAKIGHLAHCSYIDSMDKLLVSNTPECLFQIKHGRNGTKILSMPIKGTVACEKDTDIAGAWIKLSGSAKEQAELFMITDLIRNDLAKVENTPAVVTHKKLPLRVPGILHQYSVIEAKLGPSASLYDIVTALFPGGSITGAPKKRVMRILAQVEDGFRSFYCGSTIVMHKSMKAGSINIRSAEVDFGTQEMMYGAGGGITLESEREAEFHECFIKMKSFLKLIGSIP